MGWDKGGAGSESGSWKPTANGLPSLTERRAREFAWAKQHLPDEHAGMVVSALIGMEVSGQEQTRNGVMARLECQGRTMAQMKQKGWV